MSPVKNTHPPPPVNTSNFAFFQNMRVPVLASPSLPSAILQKPENLFCQGNRRLHKQISHLTSKSFTGGLFCNFSRYVKLCGGGDPPLQSNTEKSIWIACSKWAWHPGWRLQHLSTIITWPITHLRKTCLFSSIWPLNRPFFRGEWRLGSSAYLSW